MDDNRSGAPFWGNVGTGVLVVSQTTGRVLVGYRSAYVNEPHTWGVVGGKLDDEATMDIRAECRREFKEETGYGGTVKLIPAYTFKTNQFTYHNFIGIVRSEFEPKTNWETERFAWLTLPELRDLKPKHFGLKKLLADRRSVAVLMKLSAREKQVQGKRQVIAELLRAGRTELANVIAHQVVAAKELYYHGTSTVFAKRILSEGFVPNPKRKVWHPERGRLASYHGTYFSTSFGTAASAATNAAIKFGGRQCVFEVQLETRTAKMDEDQLDNPVRFVHQAARYLVTEMLYNKATGWQAERGKKENAEWLASSDAKQLVAKSADAWLKHFVEETIRPEVKPLPRKYTDRLREPTERWIWAILRAVADGTNVLDVNTPESREAIRDLMDAIGSISRLTDQSFIGQNARVPTPVGFKGANRIVAAVVSPQYHDPIYEEYRGKGYPVFVVYGNPSSNMVSKMKQAWSADLVLIKSQLSRVPNVFDPFHKKR